MSIAKQACVFVVGVLVVATQTSRADDTNLSLGVGANYSSGDYGTSTTTRITSAPVTARLDSGAWTLKLSVPYTRISGGADVIPGVGVTTNTNPNKRGRGRGGNGGTTTTSTTSSESESGMGDVVFTVTNNVYNNAAGQWGVDLSGKIKFGTADEDKGLGTGENDYSVLVDLYKQINQWTLFGGVGYTDLGSSEFIQLDNVFSASLGSTYKLNDVNSLGFSFDYREKSSDTGFSQREMTAFVVHKFNKTWKGQAYLLKGFSDGSPDWGVGASVTYGFGSI
ncbi:MAG TPA: hypothetical protein VM532_00345 [Burkholderiales bacterium]|jgi:hypothetical protein|nr:hypothetical protein [Burkholderiales bacterium]